MPAIGPPKDVNADSILSRNDLIDQIRKCRLDGKFNEAIELCRHGIACWPSDGIFSRTLCDLLFQAGHYEGAFVALADFLGSSKPSANLLTAFGKRYHRFRRVVPAKKMARFARRFSDALTASDIDLQLQRSVRRIILPDLNPVIGMEEHQIDVIRVLLDDDVNFNNFVKEERRLEDTNPDVLLAMLDSYVLSRVRSAKTYRIDLHTVSSYERLGRLDSAMRIVLELLEIKVDSVAVRSLLRLCRLAKDYTSADEILEKNPALLRSNDFNILYEFVYYFEYKNDFHEVRGVLRTIEKSFATNLPVLRTLRNFYIRFGLIEEAKGLEAKIASLFERGHKGAGRFTAEVAESEIELASKVQELYSQLEHQKQLAAISDLTTGISHELGQPITNIRYTVQFYRRIFKDGASYDELATVFDSILEETQRMGGLIRRLSPLTSSRSTISSFDVMERIRLRVEGERPRLTENGIAVNVLPRHTITVEGDLVKFDQLMSNLLVNAIDAISEKHAVGGGLVDIQAELSADEIKISFADNGPGIPIGNRNKIFDPFFSTKAPGKGEGLGLFIIWNLLKMIGGRIWVDAGYRRGAKFVLTMPRITGMTKEAVK